MRIQETDRVLKEARISRRAAAAENHSEGFMSRTWSRITSLFRRN